MVESYEFGKNTVYSRMGISRMGGTGSLSFNPAKISKLNNSTLVLFFIVLSSNEVLGWQLFDKLFWGN